MSKLMSQKQMAEMWGVPLMDVNDACNRLGGDGIKLREHVNAGKVMTYFYDPAEVAPYVLKRQKQKVENLVEKAKPAREKYERVKAWMEEHNARAE